MKNVIPFDFVGQSVRVMEREAEPWFLANDVCQILGTASRDVRKIVDADEVDTIHLTPESRGTLIVSESGLYHLIFKSRKPAAKRFRKWVTAEVLPAIRRTGKYAVEGPVDPADAADRATIPAWLGQQEALTYDELCYFGMKVRTINQAMGISYEKELHPELGRVRSYSLPVLELAWKELQRKRQRGGLQLELFAAAIEAKAA